jgi:acetyl esterase/lipase
MHGMIHDAKRAIAWMKENAANFEIDPDRIVIGGGSSGAHLALMAAYTTNVSLFTPKELEGRDTSVCAVSSLYGPADLTAMYYHTNQHLTTRDLPGKPRKAVPSEMPSWVIRMMGKEYYRLGFDKGFVNTGTFAPLLGGHPDECPDTYALYSPVKHVHPHCPPTLLIHGEHDVMAPIKSTRVLFTRLKAHKVPVTLHILPQSEHAFDLQLPGISHAAHSAIYDIEHFLDIMSQYKSNLQLTNMRYRNQASLA